MAEPLAVEIDGHLIAYEAHGEGPPILFLHGLAADRALLREACEPVAATSGFRRIYVDLPGHGASRGNPARAAADDLVDALATFVGGLGLDAPPALCGHAYGGYLALGLLRDLGAAGLLLLCPTVEADFGKRRVPPRLVLARDEGLVFTDEVERQGFDEVAVVQTQAVLESFRRLVHPGNLACDRDFIARTRARYRMARPHVAPLVGFDRPVSIVCGRHDHWVGYEDGLTLARAFSDVEYHVLPGCGHLLPIERPLRWQQSLTAWLERLSRRS
jgi:pimeloyl-ACP methyl ester carboxylesterase